MNKSIEVLIVEDSPTQAEHLKYLLEEEGYVVMTATNGLQALAATRTRRPTIIISDIMMPEMDGYGLCEAIKSDGKLKDIPVILVTDLNSPQDVVMGLQCRADNFITKPYDQQFLLTRITQSLKNKELRANGRVQKGVEIDLAGHRYVITAERHQILDLLIPTYEEAVRLNQKLREQQKELAEQVQERTAANERLLIEAAERKLAEETLRKSEEKYRTLFDSIDEGFCTIEMLFDGNDKPVDYRFLEVNPSFEKQTGIQNARGRRMREIAPLHEAHWFEIYGKIALTGEPARFESPAAQLHSWYDVYAFRVGEPQERQVAVLFNNITERKRAEEALRRAHDELEIRVQERTAEILKKTRDLETLLYVTSHDLREPLRSIENFSRMVHDRYAKLLDDKGQDFLRRVIRGAQRMDQLMTDILALSRAQRMELPAEEVEGESIVREALRQLEDKIKETGATVQVAKDLPRLQGNRIWATQGVYNLIANALKFSRNGAAPEVEIASYQPTVEDGPVVGIVVRDRGPGVAPEHAERIFQLFQRAVGREVEGTGAGLAIVRQVAERHGGRAWVQPREGGGSEFILTFGATNRSEWKEAP
jgi:PAS domain S-box-containing protein